MSIGSATILSKEELTPHYHSCVLHHTTMIDWDGQVQYFFWRKINNKWYWIEFEEEEILPWANIAFNSDLYAKLKFKWKEFLNDEFITYMQWFLCHCNHLFYTGFDHTYSRLFEKWLANSIIALYFLVLHIDCAIHRVLTEWRWFHGWMNWLKLSKISSLNLKFVGVEMLVHLTSSSSSSFRYSWNMK